MLKEGQKERVYIAGPMRGLPDENRQAFRDAAMRWREAGYEVISPVELDDQYGYHDFSEAMKRDIPFLFTCQIIALLPGWQYSEGADIETSIAKVCGIKWYDAITMEPFKETVLEEAQRIVYGPREDSYGHPMKDFSKTAKIWTGILMPKLIEGEEVTPEDVALCMVGVKMSREVNKHSRDNIVDGCGYLATLDRIKKAREDEEKR